MSRSIFDKLDFVPNRARVEAEGDAEKLSFPSEFASSGARHLAIGEVYRLLEASARSKANASDTETESKVFTDTLAYVKRFTQCNEEGIKEIRRMLGEHMSAMSSDEDVLHDFEGAALANLFPEDVEEAYSLIPSLDKQHKGGRFHPERLGRIIETLQRVKNERFVE